METKNLTCIGCPMGCAVTVKLEGETILEVTGNTCPIGERYARQEVIRPERVVTSTVRLAGGRHGRLPVKTAAAVPKGRIMDVMAAINGAQAVSPVKIGDVVIGDVCGLGVDVIATKEG